MNFEVINDDLSTSIAMECRSSLLHKYTSGVCDEMAFVRNATILYDRRNEKY